MNPLPDRIAIEELVYRYAVAIDEDDPASLAALFTDDAIIDVGRGRSDKETALATVASAVESYAGTRPRHFVTNVVVDVGPHGRASGAAYFLFTQTIDGAVTPVVTGRYSFTARRGPDGWRIDGWRAASDRSTP